MNNRVNILIDEIEKVKEFVIVANGFNEDLIIRKDRYSVDAKSLLGLFSLNLSEPVQLHFVNSLTSKVEKEFAKWIVPFTEKDVAVNFINRKSILR